MSFPKALWSFQSSMLGQFTKVERASRLPTYLTFADGNVFLVASMLENVCTCPQSHKITFLNVYIIQYTICHMEMIQKHWEANELLSGEN